MTKQIPNSLICFENVCPDDYFVDTPHFDGPECT